MTELTVRKEKVLDHNHYVISLMEYGRFTEQEIEDFQMQLYDLLDRQTNRYMHDGVTSVPADFAEHLIESILYVIGIQLKTCMSNEEALVMLRSERAEELFDRGLKRIRRMKRYLIVTQRQLVSRLFQTPNVYYSPTVTEGIKGFFKLYHPEFSAQDMHITADYPVLAGRPDLFGIEFMDFYVRCLYQENAFLNHFNEMDVHRLCLSVSKDYRSVPMNLMEPVLLCALGLKMLKKECRSLRLTEEDVRQLEILLQNCGKERIPNLADEAMYAMEEELHITGTEQEYLSLITETITRTILQACELHTLDHVFCIMVMKENPLLHVKYGERMPDTAYRKLLDEMLKCRTDEEKLRLLSEHAQSPDDRMDLLGEMKLTEEGYQLFADSLNPGEFAVFFREYGEEGFAESEHERMLCDALNRRMSRMDPFTAEQIRKLVSRISDDF